MRQLAEKVIEKDKKLYAVFVDLEKAYDKVCREELWVVLQRYGVSGDLPRAISTMYQASEACVKVDGEVTEWFKVRQGVGQGCPMLPWLFNIYLDMHGGQRSMKQFSGRSDNEYVHARCRYCCLRMTQSWLLSPRRISSTTSQHWKKQ